MPNTPVTTPTKTSVSARPRAQFFSDPKPKSYGFGKTPAQRTLFDQTARERDGLDDLAELLAKRSLDDQYDQSEKGEIPPSSPAQEQVSQEEVLPEEGESPFSNLTLS